MDNVLVVLGEWAIARLPVMGSFMLILFGFVLAGRILSAIIVSRLFYKPNLVLIRQLVAQLMNTLFVVFGLISAFGTLGIDVSAMVAALGLTGFALGLALKDSLSNIVSGILIIVYAPFKVGDKILVDKYEGVVKDINLRCTAVTLESSEVLIPNAFIFSKPISIFPPNS